MRDRVRVCVVVTASLAIKTLYEGQIKYLSERGFLVTVVSSPGVEHDLVVEEGGRSISINIERKPKIVKDLISFVRLWVHFLYNRYDLVIVSTPKASLLASLAARVSLQNNILFVVRGRAYESMKGKKRKIFEFFDYLVCRASRKVQFISKELLRNYVDSGVCPADKAVMSSLGSSKGVDVDAFSSARFPDERKSAIRREVGIPLDANVFLFCGRVRKDKGIDELCQAFQKLEISRPDLNPYLVIIGGDEFELDPYSSRNYIYSKSNVKCLGFVNDVSVLFSIANVFVFPSHREGFGNVLIEASAMSLPVIAFDVVGCREAVAPGVSGFLCDFPQVEQLAERMIQLAEDKKLQKQLGESGREWVVGNFSRDTVLEKNMGIYKEMVSM